MTTGQRIAAKRKELKLSQEALGEQLGVSRQSIYKWEADASLPEIDKLIAMSRLFSVSVGWLLGVEEEQPAQESPSPAPDETELNERQLAMVEEIVGRYLAAQPKPRKVKKWPFVLAGLVIVLVGLNLFDRLDQIDRRYQDLTISVGGITSSVDRQINTIANRVEDVLKAQNDLTSDYNAELTAIDPAQNTASFTAHITPKTYVPGMEVAFVVNWGTGFEEIPAQQGENYRFSAQFTCPLMDNIDISAVLISDGVRQTQLIDSFHGLYGASLPKVDLQGWESSLLWVEPQEGGVFQLPECYGWLISGAPLQEVQVGLFRNMELVCWLEECEMPERYSGLEEHDFFRLAPMELTLQPGDELVFAAIYTDGYGRCGAAASTPGFTWRGGTQELDWHSGDYSQYQDLTNYDLEIFIQKE